MDSLHLTTAHKATDTRIFDKEAKSLTAAGFDVAVAAHDPPTDRRDGVDFRSLGSADTRVERWRHIRSLVRIAERADAGVYHFHDPELLPVGVYLSRVTDGAVVYDVHENFGHVAQMRDWIPDWAGYALSKMVPMVEQTAATQFDAVVAVSDWIGEPFSSVTERVETVHNFPLTTSMPGGEEQIRTDADCTLCFVGGLSDVRGIHRMLDLLRELVNDGIDAELWALGRWMSETDREAAEQFIESHNLTEQVKFPGYLGYEEMFRYLRSADVGLALYDVDFCEFAIPTKFFEYLYSGLPVVTTPVMAVSEYLPAEHKYIVPQDDTPAAAEAVRRAIVAEHDGAEMQQIVEEQYSWEQESETLLALYEDLLH